MCVALMAGVLVFALIITGLTQVMAPPLEEKELPDKNIFLYAVGALTVVCMMMAFTLFNKKLRAINQSRDSVSEKFSHYQSALIVYMALCEGPALFSIIVLFLTGQFVVLAITVVLLAAMFSKLPFKNKVVTALQLDWKEQQELE